MTNKYMDIKPAPATAYDLWLNWMNHTQTKLILMASKRIKVTQL